MMMMIMMVVVVVMIVVKAGTQNTWKDIITPSWENQILG
jgi:hypothetical protein